MISQYFTHTHTDRFASSHDKLRKEDSRNYLELLVLVLWLISPLPLSSLQQQDPKRELFFDLRVVKLTFGDAHPPQTIYSPTG